MLALVPPLVAAFVRLLGCTWRVRDLNAQATPNGHIIPGPTVFAFWHGSLLACAYRFRNLGIAILISQSFDGELIARTVERLGFVAVRGSSSRGAAGGLMGMLEAYRAGHICAFTADGPKGPKHVAKPGPVHLAKLADASWIGCFHADADRAWSMNSWDRFLIPKPFARITFAWPAHIALSAEDDNAALLTQVQAGMDEAVRMTELAA
ncbi:MAG: lysophospholipid acyltransferase family protein [Acidobacteriaceae bacterium]|nr:lysophospholipid acyltransferase family protein [Acidobacteriaceae bacterium]